MNGSIDLEYHLSILVYELTLHPDLNNRAYRQWFYFEIKHGTVGVKYHFALINLAKSTSLFGSGLQPSVYSNQDAEIRHIGTCATISSLGLTLKGMQTRDFYLNA